MTLRIAEIFGPTVQGEGALIGEPTVFIRAGGCDYRCSWCDSMHAVDSKFRNDWKVMTDAEVWEEARALASGKPLTISISGGNPAIQDFGPVIELGKAEGFGFACETQGSIAKPWFALLDTLILSPKPPSSDERVDWAKVAECIAAAGPKPTIILKIVIFDDEDYAWAQDAAKRLPDLPLYLQPGNLDSDPNVPVDLELITDRLRWLIEKTTADKWFAPRILPQLHVLVWGNKRGV
ncbi:MAG: 7-carboxy-7-deazaguanine synthase QueE [Pseudomonadota bacterium]